MNQSFQKFARLSVIAAAVIAAPAFAAVGFDANIELDSTAQNMKRGVSQGGRVELNAAGKVENAAGFVAGRASYLATKTGGAAIDDMWVQFGTKQADLKLGRFEAADLFPVGKDVVVDSVTDAGGGAIGYRASELRGRKGGGVFHGALTANLAPGVALELGMVSTKTAGEATGVRPVLSFVTGPVTLKVGMESGRIQHATNDLKFSGFGITAGGNFSGMALNLNVASGKLSTNGVDSKSSSVGVNAVMGAAGVGYIAEKDKDADNTANTFYAAYSLPLFNTGATITPAISQGTGKRAGVKQDSQTSLRVRVNYAF